MIEIPEGYYEQIDVLKIQIGETSFLKRADNGTTIEYSLIVDDMSVPIPRLMFYNTKDSEYPKEHYLEFKYLKEDYSTESVCIQVK